MEAKYRAYETGQSNLQIPVKVAKILKWSDKDTILMEIKTIDGKTGIFLTKKEA